MITFMIEFFVEFFVGIMSVVCTDLENGRVKYPKYGGPF